MDNAPNRTRIVIAPVNIPFTLRNRFKTWIWNFILPPQIRLYLSDKNEELK